jgi:hypothetical protein
MTGTCRLSGRRIVELCRRSDMPPETRQRRKRKLAMSFAMALAAPLQSSLGMQTPSELVVHDPDGVPHEIIGLTWVFAIGVAICSFAALTFGGALAWWPSGSSRSRSSLSTVALDESECVLRATRSEPK